MYSVYKITNKVNGKVYVGSSVRPEQRWQQHCNTSANPNSSAYNYPLYQAFRKYGIENFSFEILSSDFNSSYDMEEYELEMIKFYDSYNNGYNQTLFTHCSILDPEIKKRTLEKRSQRCAKVDKNENIIEEYSSYQEAGRCNNFSNRANSIRMVCKGRLSSVKGIYFRDLDDNGKVIHIDFKSYKNRKPLIGILLSDPDRVVYTKSILEASTVFHIDRQSIEKCIQGSERYTHVGGYIWRQLDNYGNIVENCIKIEDVINKYNNANPMINGERHTITEWCKIYNISKTSFYRRIKRGLSVIEAITKKKER